MRFFSQKALSAERRRGLLKNSAHSGGQNLGAVAAGDSFYIGGELGQDGVEFVLEVFLAGGGALGLFVDSCGLGDDLRRAKQGRFVENRLLPDLGCVGDRLVEFLRRRDQRVQRRTGLGVVRIAAHGAMDGGGEFDFLFRGKLGEGEFDGGHNGGMFV